MRFEMRQGGALRIQKRLQCARPRPGSHLLAAWFPASPSDAHNNLVAIANE